MLDHRLLAALLGLLLPACAAATDATPMEPQPRSGGAAHMHDPNVEDVHPAPDAGALPGSPAPSPQPGGASK